MTTLGMSSRSEPVLSTNLRSYFAEVRPEIERSLSRLLPTTDTGSNGNFNEALNSAIFPGGKRIRPILTCLGAELPGGDYRNVLTAAAAVEFIHNSSLVFDDLPCMDDAVTRRGELPLHERYGEGVAVLVALNLMNAAYGLVLRDRSLDLERRVQALDEFVECIGPAGMLGGQSIDLAVDTKMLRSDALEALRNRKTTSLIRLSLRTGAILVGANSRQLEVLSQIAELVGNAYQIGDDLLDRCEDQAESCDSEYLSTKTRPGEEHLCETIGALVREAKQLVEDEFGRGRPSRLLCEISDYIGQRPAQFLSGAFA